MNIKDMLDKDLEELKDKLAKGQEQMVKLQQNAEQLNAALNQLQGAILITEKFLSSINSVDTHTLTKG